jgi:hypothetical protein
LVPKEVIINMKGPQMVWVPKDTWRPWVRGLGRLDTKKLWRFCDNPTRDNSVLSPKPLNLVIKR